MLISEPIWLTDTLPAPHFLTLSAIRFVLVSSLSYISLLSLKILKVSKPAAVAIGLPDNVPAWYTGPSGLIIRIMSARPPYAPTGIPPPTIFPRVVRSGFMLKYSCAPPIESLKPVITSSNIRRLPFSLVMSLKNSRNPCLGSTTPMLAATGSTITAAISSLLLSKSSFTESQSLYSATSVFLV